MWQWVMTERFEVDRLPHDGEILRGWYTAKRGRAEEPYGLSVFYSVRSGLKHSEIHHGANGRVERWTEWNPDGTVRIQQSTVYDENGEMVGVKKKTATLKLP